MLSDSNNCWREWRRGQPPEQVREMSFTSGALARGTRQAAERLFVRRGIEENAGKKEGRYSEKNGNPIWQRGETFLAAGCSTRVRAPMPWWRWLALSLTTGDTQGCTSVGVPQPSK